MAPSDENLFCYVIAGFWVEIPEDISRVDVFPLADHDHEKGVEGKSTTFPVKTLAPRNGDDGKPSHPATLLAARVWCFHARDQIRADADPGFDGDGQSPLPPLPQPLTAGESYAPADGFDATAAASVAQEANSPKPKRRSKKG